MLLLLYTYYEQLSSTIVKFFEYNSHKHNRRDSKTESHCVNSRRNAAKFALSDEQPRENEECGRDDYCDYSKDFAEYRKKVIALPYHNKG